MIQNSVHKTVCHSGVSERYKMNVLRQVVTLFQSVLFMTQIKVIPYHIKLLLCNIDSIFTFASPLTLFNLLFSRQGAVTFHLNVFCA